LITGIANPVAVHSQWDRVTSHMPDIPPPHPVVTTVSSGTVSASGQAPGNSTSTSERERSIAFCYRNLMNQYNQLVRRYFDLSRARATPTTDRGTDPMETTEMAAENGPSTSGLSSMSSSTTQASETSTSQEPDLESTSSGSGSESTTPVSSPAISTSSTTLPTGMHQQTIQIKINQRYVHDMKIAT